MGTVSATLTTWEEFLLLPDEEEYDKGNHLELHDGEVVVVPPPRAVHTYKQAWLVKWFTLAAQGQGYAMAEFPYRPAANLQFWRADVAYLPNEDWQALRRAVIRSTPRLSLLKCSRPPIVVPRSTSSGWPLSPAARASSGLSI